MVISLKKVLISDEVDPKCVEVLKQNGIEVVKDTKLTKDQLIAEIPKYDGLIVRSATKVTADVITAATNLKIIGRAGTGVDNIDCDAATKRGIIVMNTPGGNTLSAAEHTCALICCLSRDIPNAAHTMREGKWDRKKFMGSELYGKTLAIVGLGRIGKEVALRMQSFGMKTIGYDPIIPGEVSAEFGVDWMPLEQLWPLADYVTVHTPLIPQTRNLVGESVFKICKPTLKVVNVARGGIVDEEALLKALDSNRCGGAALDVFTAEPPKDYALAKHPKVIPTPHLGANTVEAQKRVAVEIAEQFVDVVNGKSLFGAINANALMNALSPNTRPWVELGRRLGIVAAAVSGNPKQNVQVTASGPFLKNAGSYLNAAVLSGLLQTSAGGGENVSLNLVNAPALGKELGVTVESQYEASAPAPYVNLMTVSLGGSLRLSGTTSGGNFLLTEVNGSQFATPPSVTGSIVLFKAATSPQLLATVAGTLSSTGAVVDGVAVSCEVSGTKWGVASLNTPAAPDVIKALSSVVQSAVPVNF